MNLTAAIRECAVDLLATETSVSVDHLVDCAEHRYPDSFTEARDALIVKAAKAEAKRILRALSEDEEDPAQLALPGIKLPSAIAVPNEDGTYYYVRADKAVWSEIVAGRQVREANVHRAVAKLDIYDDTMDALRPIMEPAPDLPVADAVRKLFEQ